MSYPGSKSGPGVAQWIINQIPPHDVYIEGCVGGGTILREKLPARISYAIDVDPAAVGKLADAVPDATHLVVADVIEWLRSHRFVGDEFVYLDPPYLMLTRRSQRKIYRHEFTREQHEKLLAVANRLPCPVMISGYHSDLYARQLSCWRSLRREVTTHQGQAWEWIWMNYPPPTRLHDDRFRGDDRHKRQDYQRQCARWVRRFSAMPPAQQQAVFVAIKGVYDDGAGSVGTSNGASSLTGPSTVGGTDGDRSRN